jgi:hypothetical protein
MCCSPEEALLLSLDFNCGATLLSVVDMCVTDLLLFLKFSKFIDFHMKL